MSAMPSPRPMVPQGPNAAPRPPMHLVPGGVRRTIGSLTPVMQRLAQHRTGDGRLARSLVLGSAALALAFAIAIPLAPLQQHELVRVVMPPRETTVLLEPPVETEIALPPAEAPTQMVDIERLSVHPDRAEPAVEEPSARRHVSTLAPDQGVAGRERARAATAQLASAGQALDRSLGALASSLRGAPAASGSGRRRARGVGSGRSGGEIAGAGDASSGVAVDGAAVQGARLAIGAPAPLAADPAAGEAGDATSPGVHRTNASLLAVIQRHAAGIQYCYESELQHSEGLRGKLVVALTVAASGRVTAASVVENSLASERIAACALAQIREWRFPPIAAGVTTFQAPFVFTPPR